MKLAEEINKEAIMKQKFREEQLAQQESINSANDKLTKAKEAEAKKAAEDAKKAREKAIEEQDKKIEEEKKAEEERHRQDKIDQLDAYVEMKEGENAKLKTETLALIKRRDALQERINVAKENIISTQKGMATDARVAGFKGGYNYQTDENGVIDNMIDYSRA